MKNLALATLALLLVLTDRSTAASELSPERISRRLGNFEFTEPLDRRWKLEIRESEHCAILRYSEPAGAVNPYTSAWVVAFCLTVPPEARDAGLPVLAKAYVTQDAAGLVRTVLGKKTKLESEVRKGEQVRKGMMYTFWETIDIARAREQSTSFDRAYVFFPETFKKDGTVFVFVGQERSQSLLLRPYALEEIREVIAGLKLIDE